MVTENQSFKPTLSEKTTLGSEISVPYSYTVTKSNSSYATIPVSHNVSLGLKFNQPITKAFTPGYYHKDLRKAELDIEAAKLKYGQSMFETCEKTLGLYLDTYRDLQSLKVKESSVEMSQQIHDAAKAKHAAGKASLLDLLEAQGNLLKSKESLISQSSALQSKYGDLQLAVLGNSANEIEINDNLATYLKPPQELSEEETIRQAVQSRLELKASGITLEQSKLDLKNAIADRRPAVGLESSVTYKGVADNYSTAQKQVTQGEYGSYSVGLKYEQPLLRYASTGELQQKTLRLEQEELRNAQTVRSLELNVRKDMRNVKAAWERLQLIQEMAKAERQRFFGQKLRFEQGKIAVFDLTRSQQDLENAELELIKSKVAYVKAQVELGSSTGKLFSDLGIEEP